MLASPRPVRLRRDPASRILSLLAGALLAIVAWSGSKAPPVGASEGAQPHPVLRDFQPSGRYILVPDDPRDATARVFFSQRAGAYLVRDCKTCCAFLIRTGTGVIEGVPDEAILCRDDGGCDLREDTATTSLGRFDLDGVDILFRVPGLCGRLKPPPPLLGWQRLVHLLDHSPEYGRDARAYAPDAAALAALRARPEKIQVFVYFGTWCQVCQTLMGRIVRVEQEISQAPPATPPCEKPATAPAMAEEPKKEEPKKEEPKKEEPKKAEPSGMADEPKRDEPVKSEPSGMGDEPKPEPKKEEAKPEEPKKPEPKKPEPKKPEPKRPAAPAPASGPRWSFDYYGLPPAPGTWDDPEAKLRDIDRLPMLVVYANDKYVGKIAATDASRPETALLRLLNKR